MKIKYLFLIILSMMLVDKMSVSGVDLFRFRDMDEFGRSRIIYVTRISPTVDRMGTLVPTVGNCVVVNEY